MKESENGECFTAAGRVLCVLEVCVAGTGFGIWKQIITVCTKDGEVKGRQCTEQNTKQQSKWKENPGGF